MTNEAPAKILQALKASGVLVSLKRQEVMGEAHDNSPNSGSTIAAADVDHIISDITRKYAGLTVAEIGTIKARLQAMIHNGIKNRGELTAQAEQVASAYAGEHVQQRSLPPEQEIRQLLFAINEDDKKISGLLGEMEKDGVVFNPEKKKRLVELQAWVDAHPEDKNAASYHEYVALQDELAKDGEIQADDPHSKVSNRTGVKATAKKIHLTDEERKRLQKELEEKQQSYNTKAVTTAARDEQIPEDEDQKQITVKQNAMQNESHTGQLQAPQFAGSKLPGGKRSI